MDDQQLYEAIKQLLSESGRNDVAVVMAKFDGEDCYARVVGNDPAIVEKMTRWTYDPTRQM